MRARAWFAMALILAVACGGPPPETPATGEPRVRADGGLESEEMCEEHGVLEAICTKCNPALIPVFQSKGDWCAEHGFPESFCPICHPERGGRPVVAVAGDERAPADGTRVKFKTKDTARLAGIEVAEVGAWMGGSALEVTARIVYDATKVAQVNARLDGVVRSIRTDVGATVREGSPLVTIESAEVGAEQSRIQAARSRLELAQANHTRLTTLSREGIAAEKDALAAAQELEEARAELEAAEAALRMVGKVSSDGSQYTLVSPLAGVVSRRQAAIGQLVRSGEVLFEIVDTSSMWAELDIPEAELWRVTVGQTVHLVVAGIPAGERTGTLDYIAPEIEPRTRTVKARVPLDNPDTLLRGNMFARARIAVDGAGPGASVPRAAVHSVEDADFVFTRLAEDVFEVRRVELGAVNGELVEVRGRLEPGDLVATNGSFLLKTETMKGSIGAGCCEIEEPE